MAVWKYDSAIKRGRMAGMLVYPEGKTRREGGDTAAAATTNKGPV